MCEIVGVLGVPQPKASRHLAYLRRAGLVEARREGLWMYYRLAPAQNAFHAKLLDCLACCFEDVPQLARDAKKLKQIARLLLVIFFATLYSDRRMQHESQTRCALSLHGQFVPQPDGGGLGAAA